MAYFTEEVRRELFTKLGGDVVLRGGLVVETTLDAELQRTAVAALRRGLVELDERQAYRGPLRKLAPAAIPDELAKLAVENGFAKPPAAPEAGADADGLERGLAAAPTGQRPCPGRANEPRVDAAAWSGR
jgi:penicillin-binding protein 1A